MLTWAWIQMGSLLGSRPFSMYTAGCHLPPNGHPRKAVSLSVRVLTVSRLDARMAPVRQISFRKEVAGYGGYFYPGEFRA